MFQWSPYFRGIEMYVSTLNLKATPLPPTPFVEESWEFCGRFLGQGA